MPITIERGRAGIRLASRDHGASPRAAPSPPATRASRNAAIRSEEHTSELQSHVNLVCRLLLEKKKALERVVPSAWVVVEGVRAPGAPPAALAFLVAALSAMVCLAFRSTPSLNRLGLLFLHSSL